MEPKGNGIMGAMVIGDPYQESIVLNHAFYDEVLKALWGYISDKLNIPVSRLSKDNIEEKLRNHGVNEELIKEFLNALNDCEFARFAPGDENQAMDKVYSSSIEVISRMENSIKH